MLRTGGRVWHKANCSGLEENQLSRVHWADTLTIMLLPTHILSDERVENQMKVYILLIITHMSCIAIPFVRGLGYFFFTYFQSSNAISSRGQSIIFNDNLMLFGIKIKVLLFRGICCKLDFKRMTPSWVMSILTYETKINTMW